MPWIRRNRRRERGRRSDAWRSMDRSTRVSEEKNFPRAMSIPRRVARRHDKPPPGDSMKYFAFIRHSESYRANPPPAGLMKAMGEFVERSRKNGSLVDTGGFLPSKDGARIQLRKGKITVTD